MGKKALKQALGAAGDLSLVDTDRIEPKAKGGTYTKKNTRLMKPRQHMRRHGTLRVRKGRLKILKAIFDDRVQTMKLQNKINNQLKAYQRRVDDCHPATEAFLTMSLRPVEQHLKDIDKSVKQQVHKLAEVDPLVAAALGVLSLGEITIAALTIYIDFEKADSASATWKYTGLHKASHERYTKNEPSGGNKTLRTVLWNSANAMMKNRNSSYRPVYDNVKHRLAHSARVVRSRNTQGQLIECAWKDTKPSHRHGAALRAIMKHLLADYWFVGRDLAGLPTRPLYVEEKLGHTGIIRPEERGWEW